jgi:hypothetical protein
MGKVLNVLMLPNRVIKRCPAIILAVRRTLREIGRIKLLRDSTKIMNGAIKLGVPTGNKCVNIKFVKFNQLNVINEIQIGSPNDKAVDKCLVGVNV